MSSGIGVNSACLSEFQALKVKRRNKYVLFHLNKDNTEIVVEKTSTATDYDEFLGDLPEDQCRWAVYDFEFEAADSGKRNKILFVSWSPDSARVKDKMLHSSSKDALRRCLVGIGAEIQATDISEISYDTVLDRVRR